jgi:hypothetical protein
MVPGTPETKASLGSQGLGEIFVVGRIVYRIDSLNELFRLARIRNFVVNVVPVHEVLHDAAILEQAG